LKTRKEKKEFRIINRNPLEFEYLGKIYTKHRRYWAITIINPYGRNGNYMNTNTLRDIELPRMIRLLYPEVNEILS
jgi:hypothetical protein